MENLIEPGDIVWRTKDGVWEHPGVAMPGGMVYENRPQQGEHLSWLSNFKAAAGPTLRVTKQSSAKRAQNIHAAYRELRNPRAYNPLLNNCQDAVSRVTHGAPSSHQRDLLLGLVLVVGGLALLSR